MKFLLWAVFSLAGEITFDEVYWVASPMVGALVVIIGLDVYDHRKQRRRKRSGL